MMSDCVSHWAKCTGGSCSEDIHMEEEKVEDKAHEDEVEDGRDQ